MSMNFALSFEICLSKKIAYLETIWCYGTPSKAYVSVYLAQNWSYSERQHILAFYIVFVMAVGGVEIRLMDTQLPSHHV